MDNLLGTIVFLLPGFLMYFWIQAFGVNPVVKHSQAEFTAISAIMWLPVSFAALLVYNGIIHILEGYYTNGTAIWNVADLKEKSTHFLFLLVFLLISTVVSFIFSVIWSNWVFIAQLRLINIVRGWRKFAELSKTASVWDEVFLNKNAQVVGLCKIDKDEPMIIGCIEKTSRTFEPERYLYLNDVDFFTDLVNRHHIPITNVLIDTKSGTVVKVFDPKMVETAQRLDMENQNVTSS